MPALSDTTRHRPGYITGVDVQTVPTWHGLDAAQVPLGPDDMLGGGMYMPPGYGSSSPVRGPNAAASACHDAAAPGSLDDLDAYPGSHFASPTESNVPQMMVLVPQGMQGQMVLPMMQVPSQRQVSNDGSQASELHMVPQQRQVSEGSSLQMVQVMLPSGIQGQMLMQMPQAGLLTPQVQVQQTRQAQQAQPQPHRQHVQTEDRKQPFARQASQSTHSETNTPMSWGSYTEAPPDTSGYGYWNVGAPIIGDEGSLQRCYEPPTCGWGDKGSRDEESAIPCWAAMCYNDAPAQVSQREPSKSQLQRIPMPEKLFTREEKRKIRKNTQANSDSTNRWAASDTAAMMGYGRGPPGNGQLRSAYPGILDDIDVPPRIKGSRGRALQPTTAAPKVPTSLDVPPWSAMDTMKAQLQALQSEDPASVFIARRINKLGFSSAEVLRKYFAVYGGVKGVFVSHSRVKSCLKSVRSIADRRTNDAHRRLRAAALGFVVMESPSATLQILEDGPEHIVEGVSVRVHVFYRRTCEDELAQEAADAGLYSDGEEPLHEALQEPTSFRDRAAGRLDEFI